MRRRDFIKGIVGSATAWPLVARAQQGEHMRRIGVLMNIGVDYLEAPALVGAFSQGLGESGWIIGRNEFVEAGGLMSYGANLADRSSRFFCRADVSAVRMSPTVNR